jgi:hypothetical protein
MFHLEPTMLFCQQCDTGYGSLGELPSSCQACKQFPDWTTIKPYRLSFNDRAFLKSIHIEAIDRTDVARS